MSTEDGGPAFPVAYIDDAASFDLGMSIRDWFAGQALAGSMARTTVPDADLRAMFGAIRNNIRREEIVAADAYRIADAMLKARGRS